MSHRIVSIVLILAVTLCPLWCGMGVCCADLDRSLADCVPELGSVATAHGDCCCGNGAPHGESPRSNDHRPEHQRCQGICGGAVVEKSQAIRASCPGPELFARVATDRSPCRAADADVGSYAASLRSSSIYGRSLRAQQMSWLC